MGKFWKEIVGGQVQQGVYQAGPRHASRQYGSFKTGRPPRLPFQFVTYFELNPQLKNLHMNKDEYHYSSLVRAIDMPTVSFTVEKRNQYNKLKPVILTKDFKPFSMTVYDDIESRWYSLWQHYYNYHFMDGRNLLGDLKSFDHNDVVATTDLGDKNPFNSDFAGPDIHSNEMRNYFSAIHVFQIHGQHVTRTTAINPVLQDAQVTQLDYASSGVPSEIIFNIEYEKLEYGPEINMEYEDYDNGILTELLEDYTKSAPFNPTQDKVRGLVKGLFGLEQSNITRSTNQLHTAQRDVNGNPSNAALLREGGGTTSGGFFTNLLTNALNTKIDEASGSLFKKNNKNLNKLNFF
jgi:hypothetical protein